MQLLDLQQSPAEFRKALLIDTDTGPQPLHNVIDDWQRADFEALDAGWQRAAGQRVEGECRQRAWLERGRGHSKSSDVMTMAAWCLFASRKKLSGVVCAVDREQAALDRDHVARLVSLNPWLGDVLKVHQWRVHNPHTDSSMDIMTSDVASSYGLLIDFAVCDEVTIWPKRDLFDSVLSATAKRSTCLLLCIGNAGFQDSWQATLRDAIRNDPSWYYSRLDGPVASWISKDLLAEQERLLPRAAYERLWLNIWSSGAGDAISPADVAAAFHAELTPIRTPLPGYEYVAGVDAGVSRDASAVCVLGIRRGHTGHGIVRLAYTQVWHPAKDQRVDLQQVEDALLLLHQCYDFRQLNYDPWQMTHLASRLQSAGLGKLAHGRKRATALPMVEVAPTGSNLQRMATVLLEAFADRRLELYADPDLRRDLTRMRVEERSYGFRLVSPRDAHGHGDLGTAFALAMLAAADIAATPTVTIGSLDNPADSYAQQFAERQAAHAAEQEYLKQPTDHQLPFRRLMQQCGRAAYDDFDPFIF